MQPVSDELAQSIGVPADAPGWLTARAELVEYVQRIIAGLSTPIPALSRGLGLPEPVVQDVSEGRPEALVVDDLLLMLRELELPVSLTGTPEHAVRVEFAIDISLP